MQVKTFIFVQNLKFHRSHFRNLNMKLMRCPSSLAVTDCPNLCGPTVLGLGRQKGNALSASGPQPRISPTSQGCLSALLSCRLFIILALCPLVGETMAGNNTLWLKMFESTRDVPCSVVESWLCLVRNTSTLKNTRSNVCARKISGNVLPASRQRNFEANGRATFARGSEEENADSLKHWSDVSVSQS